MAPKAQHRPLSGWGNMADCLQRKSSLMPSVPAGTRFGETGGKACAEHKEFVTRQRKEVHFKGRGTGTCCSWEAGRGSVSPASVGFRTWASHRSIGHGDKRPWTASEAPEPERHPPAYFQSAVCHLVWLSHPRGGWQSKCSALNTGHGHGHAGHWSGVCRLQPSIIPGLDTEPVLARVPDGHCDPVHGEVDAWPGERDPGTAGSGSSLPATSRPR